MATVSSLPLPQAAGTSDAPSDWHEFSRPDGGGDALWESVVAIEGMYCAACSLNIEQALRAVPGVRSASVSGASRLARVVWAADTTQPEQWMQAVARAGYRALPAGDQRQADERRRAQRVLLWRWLVAGFCMMQVMMYAVPAYVAGPGEMDAEMTALLRWASWVLSLPLLLFSCRPFFASAWHDVRAGRIGMDVPVALGIAIAFAASSAATFDPSGRFGAEVWFDSLAMFVFFLLSGRLLEQRLRNRTAGALEALMNRLPDTVECQQADGQFRRVSVRRLAAGDVIRVLAGEVIPADGTVLEGRSEVDEALLTGESTPLARAAGGAVIAGSHNLGATLVVRVERTGGQTRYAAIVALMEQAALDKPRLAQLADRVAGPFLLAVVLASLAAAAWWWPSDPAHAVRVAVAILIVTCPCALGLATPVATLAAAGALARRGVLVRRLQALETGAAVDTVVFDKTGTLSQDRLDVVATRVRAGADAAQALQMAAALASQSLHAASRALVQSAQQAAEASSGAPRPVVVASEVAELAGQGVRGLVAVDGQAAQPLRLGSAALCGIAAPPADGPTQVHLADAQGWLASFELHEALRADARRTIEALRARGLRVELLSGDQGGAVRRLADRAGITLAAGQHSPQDKLDHLQRLQQQGRRVMMVGDGMNDGPVLARADLSVAMERGVPLVQARADAVVLGERLGGVVTLLWQARRTQAVVRQNLAWAAAYNALCVPLAVLGWLPPWLAGLGMAASSLGVVLNSARLSRLPGGDA